MKAVFGIFGIVLWSFSSAAYDVDVIENNGDPANRIDIAILGDGYRLEDQTKLVTDVNSFLSLFWQQVPLNEYHQFFNVKLVHVISNENGADNGSYGAVRDTALGAYFNCSGIQRLICLDWGTAQSVVGSHVPEHDVVFVIVNDPLYGGSGGSMAVFSTNAASGQIAIHEFGHTFARLADEYEDSIPGDPGCSGDCWEPNVTTQTERNLVKWNPWIDASTPVPTPEVAAYLNAIGVFEGARYHSVGIYRPKQNCEMRSLGMSFCSVCAEAMIWAIYNLVEPIDGVSPVSPIDLSFAENVQLAITHPVRSPDTFLAEWSVDGQVKSSGVDSYTLQGLSLSVGPHEVKVRLSDETTLVRNDPLALLLDEFSWTVNVSSGGDDGDAGEDAGDAGVDGSTDGSDEVAEDGDAGEDGSQDAGSDEEIDAGGESGSGDTGGPNTKIIGGCGCNTGNGRMDFVMFGASCMLIVWIRRKARLAQ
jgi:hypothetical protein